MAKEAAAKVEPTPTPEPTPEATLVSASTPAAEPEVPAGKVKIPDPEPTPVPPGLQLTPEIKTWLEERNLPGDENGLKMILGHIDQEILDAHQTQERVRQEQTRQSLAVRAQAAHAVAAGGGSNSVETVKRSCSQYQGRAAAA